MAIFFWRKQQLDDEQILASLDRQIRRTEVRVSSIRQRHQRIKHAWLYYSVSIYVFVLVLYFTYLKPRRDPWDIWLVKTGVVVVGAPGIYFGNRFIRYWYQRKEKAERDLLESLKAKQKEKVDALKENEAYRKTQLLLQRYDTPTKDRPAGDELVDAKGHSRPTTPLPFPPSHIKMGQPSKQMGPPSLAPPGTPGMAPVPGKQIDNPTQTTRSPSPSPAFLSIPPFDPTQLPNRYSPLPPPPTPTPQHPYAKTWFDKVIDVMIGETNDTNSPASKYALICEECFTHNGLVPAEAYSDARFRCMRCDHLTIPKRYASMISPSNLSPSQSIPSDLNTASPRHTPPPPGGDGGHVAFADSANGSGGMMYMNPKLSQSQPAFFAPRHSVNPLEGPPPAAGAARSAPGHRTENTGVGEEEEEDIAPPASGPEQQLHHEQEAAATPTPPSSQPQPQQQTEEDGGTGMRRRPNEKRGGRGRKAGKAGRRQEGTGTGTGTDSEREGAVE